jgi:hypothetical protein
MFRSANRFHRFALLVLVLAGSQVPVLAAQDPPHRPWTVTAAFTGLRSGGVSGWLYGPELGIRRDFGGDIGPRWGVELRASLPLLDTDQGTDDDAGFLDLGPTLRFASDKGEFVFSAGATAFLVGDRGEFVDGGIGGFFGGQGTVWLSKHVGAVAGARARLSGGGSVYPSLSAGLAVRF